MDAVCGTCKSLSLCLTDSYMQIADKLVPCWGLCNWSHKDYFDKACLRYQKKPEARYDMNNDYCTECDECVGADKLYQCDQDVFLCWHCLQEWEEMWQEYYEMFEVRL